MADLLILFESIQIRHRRVIRMTKTQYNYCLSIKINDYNFYIILKELKRIYFMDFNRNKFGDNDSLMEELKLKLSELK